MTILDFNRSLSNTWSLRLSSDVVFMIIIIMQETAEAIVASLNRQQHSLEGHVRPLMLALTYIPTSNCSLVHCSKGVKYFG